MPREEIIRAMRVDKKKNAGAIRFALPVEIGQVESGGSNGFGNGSGGGHENSRFAWSKSKFAGYSANPRFMAR